MFITQKAIVFLQRSGLLIAGKHLASVRFEFTPEMVTNLEVLQRDQLITACRQFFAEHGLHGKRIILALDYGVVFEKVIELDQSGQPDKLVEGFVAAMPFEPGQRACLSVEAGSQLRLFATNATLYGAIDEALRTAGTGSVAVIAPVAAYNLAETDRTVSSATDRILKDTLVAKQANFRNVAPA